MQIGATAVPNAEFRADVRISPYLLQLGIHFVPVFALYTHSWELLMSEYLAIGPNFGFVLCFFLFSTYEPNVSSCQLRFY